MEDGVRLCLPPAPFASPTRLQDTVPRQEGARRRRRGLTVRVSQSKRFCSIVRGPRGHDGRLRH
eukprot:11223312-Lingulodinium_polyedra.AAC.1